MDTKLTLKLDKDAIERVKKYAAMKKVSVSSIVENHFNALTLGEESDTTNEIKISELAKKIAIDGIIGFVSSLQLQLILITKKKFKIYCVKNTVYEIIF